MSLGTGSLYAFGPFRLDPRERRLLRDGRVVPLTPKAFDLLVLLVSRAGRLVTKQDALKEIWPDTFIEEGNLSYTMSLLRKALGDDAEPHRYVETVPRRGYRFSAVVDVHDVVDEVGLPSVAEAPAPARARRSRAYAVVAVAALVVGLAATLTWVKRSAVNDPPAVTPRPPVRLTMGGGLVNMPAISRDGTMVAYAAADQGETNFDIWVQQIAGGGAFRLTTDPLDDLNPAFSPDGATIAFQRPHTAAKAAPGLGSTGSLGIFLVPTLGGQPRLLVADGGNRPTFSPDGNWLAYTRSTGVGIAEVFVVAVRGGPPKRLAQDLTWADRAVWSPDSAHILTMGHRERWPPFRNDWFLVPLDGGPSVETGVAAILHHSPERSMLVGENTRSFPKPQAWHAADNRIIYYAPDGDTKNLWQVRIDPAARRIVGAPERVTHGTNDEEMVSVSASGRMVYTSYDLRVDLWSVPLSGDGISASGPLQQLTNDAVDDFNPDVSPDGRLLAYASRRRGGQFAVVVRDLATGNDREFGTTSEMPGPTFSPDGRQVAYAVRRPGGGPMFVADLATGSVEQVCDSCGVMTQWHTVGDLIIGSLQSQSGLTLFSLPDRRLRPLVRHEGLYLFVPSFSPDSRWLTFSVSDEGGGSFFPSIVIAPVRNGVPAARSEWVTVAEGHQIGRWSARGDALIFFSTCEETPCISAQRLDEHTKRPVGPRREIARFADRTLSPRDVEPSNGLRVGADRIVFAMGSRRGNLWMTDLPPARD